MRALRVFQSGFTLIELMVAVTVAVIILMLAVPSFQTFIARSHAVGATTELHSVLAYARSEAIKRSRRVVVCRGSSTACGGSGDWSDGVVAFVDVGSPPNGALDSGETVLRTLAAFHSRVGITADANVADRVAFGPAGNALNAGDFLIYTGSDDALKRVLSVSASGHVNWTYYSGEG